MEPHVTNTDTRAKKTNVLFIVTPLSKYLALALFIILPFLGFWLGTLWGPLPTPTDTYTDTFVPRLKTVRDITLVEEVASTTYQLDIQSKGAAGAPDLEVPQTEIILRTNIDGDISRTSLGVFDGTCTINSIINVYDNLTTYITNPTHVVNQISCWFAGTGSETYLYQKTAVSPITYEIISFETGECENLLIGECSPYGPVSVLKTGLGQ